MSVPGTYKIYQRLFKHYGPQHWWPGETAFEIMVGAVLTQNTSWTNVERAIGNLKQHDALNDSAILAMSHKRLARLLTPVGYFNVKATRLKNFCRWHRQHAATAALRRLDTHELRRMLLAINGVGPETADDILLYALDRPVFVIDAYTRRLFTRLGLLQGDEGYETLRHWFESKLRRVTDKVGVFNEYHALIVHHAKYYCRSKPRCSECCLKSHCAYHSNAKDITKRKSSTTKSVE